MALLQLDSVEDAITALIVSIMFLIYSIEIEIQKHTIGVLAIGKEFLLTTYCKYL